jgi:hypothetical protein
MTVHTGRHFLQIPGPTNVPDRILRAMDRPVIDHRSPEFGAMVKALLATPVRSDVQVPADIAPLAEAFLADDHHLAVEHHVALGRLDVPEDRLECRGLPAGVPAQQAHHLAGEDLDVHVAEHGDQPVVGTHVA